MTSKDSEVFFLQVITPAVSPLRKPPEVDKNSASPSFPLTQVPRKVPPFHHLQQQITLQWRANHPGAIHRAVEPFCSDHMHPTEDIQYHLHHRMVIFEILQIGCVTVFFIYPSTHPSIYLSICHSILYLVTLTIIHHHSPSFTDLDPSILSVIPLSPWCHPEDLLMAMKLEIHRIQMVDHVLYLSW